MSEESPGNIVRRWLEEGWNDGNLDLIDDLFSPLFKAEGGPHGILDRLSYRQYAQAVRAAAPDLTAELIEVMEAGEFVITRVISSGTHTGEIPGIGASKKTFSTEVVDVWKVIDGLIVERRNAEFDTVGLSEKFDRSVKFTPTQ